MEEHRSNVIKEAETKKETKIAALTKEHNNKYIQIKNYYADITATNLDLIKQLKNEINEMQKKEEQDKKMLTQIEKELHDLSFPLKSLDDEIVRLNLEMDEHKKIKHKKEDIKKVLY